MALLKISVFFGTLAIAMTIDSITEYIKNK